jgi:hypothetical protein
MLGLSLVTLGLGANSQAADPLWLAPIEDAYARLDSKLENFRVTVTAYSQEHRVGKPATERKFDRTFEVSRARNCIKSVSAPDPSSNRKVYAAVNDNYFFLIADNQTGPRSLVDLGERMQFTVGNVGRRGALQRIAADSVWILGVFGYPFESPTAVLKYNANRVRATEVRERGRELLLLEGDFSRFSDTTGASALEASNMKLKGARIFLDPGLDYRIVRIEWTVVERGIEFASSQSFDYGLYCDGYPVLSSVTFRSNSPRGSGEYVTEFSDWSINVNNPAEFRLPYYGLKEPSYGGRPWLSGWMWLLLVGGALVIVGGWLYRRTRSR